MGRCLNCAGVRVCDVGHCSYCLDCEHLSVFPHCKPFTEHLGGFQGQWSGPTNTKEITGELRKSFLYPDELEQASKRLLAHQEERTYTLEEILEEEGYTVE
jgi:hypothetical protein